MHGTTWFTLSELPFALLWRPTLSGYNGASSRMTERHRDTVPDDRPEMVGAWVDGTYYLGEAEGGSGEWLSAESTVEIKHTN